MKSILLREIKSFSVRRSVIWSLPFSFCSTDFSFGFLKAILIFQILDLQIWVRFYFGAMDFNFLDSGSDNAKFFGWKSRERLNCFSQNLWAFGKSWTENSSELFIDINCNNSYLNICLRTFKSWKSGRQFRFRKHFRFLFRIIIFNRSLYFHRNFHFHLIWKSNCCLYNFRFLCFIFYFGFDGISSLQEVLI